MSAKDHPTRSMPLPEPGRREPAWRKWERVSVPALMLIGGLTMLISGLLYSEETVYYEEEVTITQAAPKPPPQMPGFLNRGPMGPGGPNGPRAPMPAPPPPPPVTRTITVEESVEETERKIVLEITRGGLIRDDQGRLKRTYASGRPPSGCPT